MGFDLQIYLYPAALIIDPAKQFLEKFQPGAIMIATKAVVVAT